MALSKRAIERMDRIAAEMRRTAKDRRYRYFGANKVRYEYVDTFVTKGAAELKAASIRRKGYGARITTEKSKFVKKVLYAVWESHFPRS